MSKVYCKNCIFDLIEDYGPIYNHYCNKKIERKNKYNNEVVYEKYISYSENNTGNCKYYKRKWWKFWIKA